MAYGFESLHRHHVEYPSIKGASPRRLRVGNSSVKEVRHHRFAGENPVLYNQWYLTALVRPLPDNKAIALPRIIYFLYGSVSRSR